MFWYKYDGFINRKTWSTAKEVEEVEVGAALEKEGHENKDDYDDGGDGEEHWQWPKQWQQQKRQHQQRQRHQQ